MTVLLARTDVYGKQVFYCTSSCTISLHICTVIWTVFAAVGYSNCIFNEGLKINLLALLTVSINRLHFLTHQQWPTSLLVLRLFPW